MRSVLFITDSYLHDASPNGICVEKIIAELLTHKVSVSVLLTRQYYGANDQEANENVSIYETKGTKKASETKTNRLLNYAKWLLPARFPFTANMQLSERIVEKAEEIITQNIIDTIVCVHFPTESLTAGREIKIRHADIEVIAYMLDSLSGGFIPRFLPASFTRKRKLLWEKRLLKDFDKIILMESSRMHHETRSKLEEWYRNAVYLDIPALKRPNLPNKSKCIVGKQISISFAGTLLENLRTPYAFLNIISRINDIDINIYFAGVNNCDNNRLKLLLNILEGKDNISIFWLGKLDHNKSIELLRESDYLLNIGNANCSLLPSKIFEYMSFGKPIISTYSIDDDACISYIKQYPLSLMIDERDTNIDQQAEMVKKFICENVGRTILFEEVEKHFYYNTPKAFYESLKQDSI